MKEFFKKFSVSLLTIVVIGSIGGFLSQSLADSQPQPVTETSTVQASAPVIETVTVVGNKWVK